MPYGGPMGPTGATGATGAPGNATVFGTPAVGNIPKFKDSVTVEDSGIPVAMVGQPFPAGTKMLFVQSAAPSGWTKDTDQNDKVLRIVSGTAGSGGTLAFSTVFARMASDPHVLTIAEMPRHDHPNGYPADTQTGLGYSAGGTAKVSTGFTGGDQPHSHNIDIRVQYVNVIKATKN